MAAREDSCQKQRDRLKPSPSSLLKQLQDL